LLGAVFDRRFRMDAKIAVGGFGAIYRATHLKSGHEFALKVLHPNLTNDPGVLARFRREGAALTRLRDPHTITAYELGETEEGTLYIVMELLRGQSLYERFRARGPLPWQRVVAIARAVCSSLAEAHALGIIHRDLKPTNIHLEPRGNEQDFVKVLDFGIAKVLQDSDIDSSDLTQAGQMIGTLDYMSPEQMVGGMCTPSSDIYTLGVVMYEMIAGAKPFDDANSPAVALAAVLTTTPPRLSTRAVVTPEVDQVVMRCLERQHTDRFQTAVDLATALDEILPGAHEVVTMVGRGSGPKVPESPRRVPANQDAVPMSQDAVQMDPDAVTVDSEPGAARPLLTTPMPGPMTPRPGYTTQMPAAIPPRPSPKTPMPALAPRPRSAGSELTVRPPPVNLGGTLSGYRPAERLPPVVRARQVGTPPVGTPNVPVKHLHQPNPVSHQPTPAPLHPSLAPFGDRSAAPVGMAPFGDHSAAPVGMAPFDMAGTVRRGAVVRRLALGIGIAIMILAVLLITNRL
jgi:serine/threonine-protein kinase